MSRTSSGRVVTDPPADQESARYLHARLSVLSTLLRGARPRDLTPLEYAAMVPLTIRARVHAGCRQNQVRGAILRSLNAAGFTVHGKRCT